MIGAILFGQVDKWTDPHSLRFLKTNIQTYFVRHKDWILIYQGNLENFMQ